MVYDRNRGGFDDRSDDQGYGRDYGSGQDYTYSSAREYMAAGELRGGGRDYGRREYGNRGYEDREQMYRGGGMNRERDYGRFGDRGSSDRGGEPYRGSYAHDGRRFAEVDRSDDDRDYGRDRGRAGSFGGYDRDDRSRSYGRMGSGRDRDERGFFDRAADEVRSWFSDDDDRGRDFGAREGRRVSGNWQGDRVHDHRDRHYHEWRQGQISQLDRDYDEYRREHQSKFDNEFSSWRTNRQTQRQMLNQVEEHAEVFGSDGERIGTVDKVRGDRIILTKNDRAAGGHHHSIPSSWLQSAEAGRVTLSKSSIEAKTMWRDEEYQEQSRRSTESSEDREHSRSDQAGMGQGSGPEARDNQGRILNRSFSGTYDEK